MPSGDSPTQTDLPPQIIEQATTPNSDPEVEAKDGDDLGTSIEKIRKIVDDLDKKFPYQPPKPRSEQIRKTQSNVGTTKTNDQHATLQKSTSVPADFPKPEDSNNSIQMLKRNLEMLEADVDKLRVLNETVGEEVTRQMIPLGKLHTKVKDSSTTHLTKGMKKDLEGVNKKIFKLMCEVPLLANKRRKPGGLDSEDGDEDNNGKGIVCLPGIHANKDDLTKRQVFKDVLREIKALETNELKMCLLSFAVFPENQEVNRTMLMYWWIGEGILPAEFKPPVNSNPSDEFKPPGNGILPVQEKTENVAKEGNQILLDEKKPENVVKEILKYFTERKLIEAVENKRKVEPNSYKMTPFVHSSVVLISQEIGLFDMYSKGDKPTMNQSDQRKVCLVEESSNQPEARAKKMPEAEKIESVFNVSERFPDFTFKWFTEEHSSGKKRFRPLSKTTFKALKVFYLGRWERTAKRHIEVENPELMKNLKHMTKLKLLSFQGISRIERLDDAVCKLQELIILDLRACYNLEKLPEKIDSLEKLIYLDITDCYMIDRMPKRLSWLENLEVLKGFVVSDATDEETFCTLAALKDLKKLRKLSIAINKREFSVDDLFRAIEKFEKLEKLKMAWGGFNPSEPKKDSTPGGTVKKFFEKTVTMLLRNDAAAEPELPKSQKPPKLPTTLTKLDLQCFPDAVLPEWLKPEKLLHLEKLYIKGGIELTGFGKVPPEEPTKCNVKVLRLKFLPRLKVEWRELSETYFPNLEFLDKYQCPQVSLCPCDGIGIWRKPEKHQV